MSASACAMRARAAGRDPAPGRRGARPGAAAAQAEKLPGQLSGGQQQRVAIARAIVDRAAARADGRAAVQPRRQAAARDARRDPPHPPRARPLDDLRHARPGRGAVARRPHRRAAARADRSRSATPEELYARPANLDVARFMGYRNVLDARRRARSTATRVVAARRRDRARRDRAAGACAGGRATVGDPPRRSRRRSAAAPTRSTAASRSSNIAAATGSSTSSCPTGRHASTRAAPEHVRARATSRRVCMVRRPSASSSIRRPRMRARP